MKRLSYFLPLILIILGMLFLYFSGLYRALDFDTVKYHHNELTEFVNNHPVVTPILFTASYAIIIALSIPGKFILALLGGFLFPQPFCTFYVLIGATAGATCLFLSVKFALKSFFKDKVTPFLDKMEKGFRKNETSYMLFLRFTPFFPYWIVNLVPAFFNVGVWTYIWTTFIGSIPGTFFTTQAGRGLNTIFETSESFDTASIFTIEMKIALVCLAFFSLVPILIKKWKKK